MKHMLISFVVAVALTVASFGQSGADKEKAVILRVFNEYIRAMQAEQPERDRIREQLLTDDYFYMGMDGLPAGKSSVMERQKRNGLRITEMKMNDVKIRLYDKTAIITMRSAGAGVDKGNPWGGDGKENGHTMVMVKQKGSWRVAADVVGIEIGS